MSYIKTKTEYNFICNFCSHEPVEYKLEIIQKRGKNIKYVCGTCLIKLDKVLGKEITHASLGAEKKE